MCFVSSYVLIFFYAHSNRRIKIFQNVTLKFSRHDISEVKRHLGPFFSIVQPKHPEEGIQMYRCILLMSEIDIFFNTGVWH